MTTLTSLANSCAEISTCHGITNTTVSDSVCSGACTPRKGSLSYDQVIALLRHNIPLYGVLDYEIVPITSSGVPALAIFDNLEDANIYLFEHLSSDYLRAKSIIAAYDKLVSEHPELSI